MGRPTTEDVENRQALIKTGFFKRDHEIYTSYEKYKGLNDYEVAYLFCEQCHIRDTYDHFRLYRDSDDARPINSYEFLKDHEQLNSLDHIDKDRADYYGEIMLHTLKSERYQFDQKTPVSESLLIKIFDRDRARELISNYYLGDRITYQEVRLENILDKMTSEEHERFYEYLENNHLFPKTLIVSDIRQNCYPDKQNTVFAEIDLSKPLPELLAFIERIKRSYDKDNKTVQNIYQLLDQAPEPFTCDVRECDVLKKDKRKPLLGKLMDALFIYDCKHVNMTNDYIKEEIDRFWQEVQKAFSDKVRTPTIKGYHELAKDYIEDKKYELCRSPKSS